VTSAPPAGAAPVKEDTSTEAGTVTTPPLDEVVIGMAVGETADVLVT
jgi:hypothetical protein